MAGIRKQLKWESLQKRKKDNRIILFYKSLKGRAKYLLVTLSQIIGFEVCRIQHSLAIHQVQMPIYIVFFPKTVRDWNDLSDYLIASAVMSGDCVSKFTSLVVRALD